jgi:hypothetical protein
VDPIGGALIVLGTQVAKDRASARAVHSLRIDSNVDVPHAVYEHAVLCECAHARLRALGRVG